MTRKWSVTEATDQSAFLSVDSGDDVAILKRLPSELYESESPLTGEEWQSMIDLVAAAPAMLAALQNAKSMLIDLYEEKYPDDETDNALTRIIDKVIAVINTANGKDRIPHEQ